ncbi:MAG: electron transfer flavoprotein subunit alpha/FixB family protein, partial [Actinomycetes bacterium]
MSQVLILVDSVGGQVSKSTGELATFGSRLGSVTAVVFDPALAAQLTGLPIDNIVVVTGVDASKYSPAPV